MPSQLSEPITVEASQMADSKDKVVKHNFHEIITPLLTAAAHINRDYTMFWIVPTRLPVSIIVFACKTTHFHHAISAWNVLRPVPVLIAPTGECEQQWSMRWLLSHRAICSVKWATVARIPAAHLLSKWVVVWKGCFFLAVVLAEPKSLIDLNGSSISIQSRPGRDPMKPLNSIPATTRAYSVINLIAFTLFRH